MERSLPSDLVSLPQLRFMVWPVTSSAQELIDELLLSLNGKTATNQHPGCLGPIVPVTQDFWDLGWRWLFPLRGCSTAVSP